MTAVDATWMLQAPILKANQRQVSKLRLIYTPGTMHDCSALEFPIWTNNEFVYVFSEPIEFKRIQSSMNCCCFHGYNLLSFSAVISLSLSILVLWELASQALSFVLHSIGRNFKKAPIYQGYPFLNGEDRSLALNSHIPFQRPAEYERKRMPKETWTSTNARRELRHYG